MSVLQLANLRRKNVFYQHDAPDWVRNLWPRPESFDWFVRSHRQALVSNGALIKLGRDYLVDASTFPEAAARILGVADGSTGGQQ